MSLVVKEWLINCSLKQQTVLLCALRGYDGASKEDISKKFVRKLRNVILKNASPNGGQFMEDFITESEYKQFLKQPDIYNIHWLFHFLHAVEIIGYKHPKEGIKQWFHKLYIDMVNMLHLNPETESECDQRLQDGLVGDNIKEDFLNKLQAHCNHIFDSWRKWNFNDSEDNQFRTCEYCGLEERRRFST